MMNQQDDKTMDNKTMNTTTTPPKAQEGQTIQERRAKAEELLRGTQVGNPQPSSQTATATPATAPQTAGASHQLAQKVKAQGNLSGLSQGQIGTFLQSFAPQLTKVLPRHLTAERIIQMTAGVVHRNPAIARCSVPSLLGAVMQASLLGFQPIDSLGYCYFVPYGKDVQFQIGYKGLIDLARRSGKIRSVHAEVVHEGDEFECEYGLSPSLKHRPAFEDGAKLTHAYAVVHFTDGGNSFVVLPRVEIERLRMRSPMQKGAPSGAWATDYDAMAKAKALKQLAKYLPLSVEEQTAVLSDERVISFEHFDRGGQLKAEELEYSEPIEVDPETGEVLEG